MNRTLVEKVRCMLIDMNLSKKLWAEALHAAANIVNVPPNEMNKKSPDEMWLNMKPDLNNFKVFGCKALVMIPYEKRKKLDDKAFECIFLRRAENSKAFRLFNMKTNDIIISRDVVFYEEKAQEVKNADNESNFFYFSYEGEDETENDHEIGIDLNNTNDLHQANEDNSNEEV